jgi:inositol transport system ATP-binding protein
MQKVEPSPTNCEAKTQLGGMESPHAVLTSSPKKKSIKLMNQWTARGIAILLITSEMTELLTLSDRIAVMQCGQVTAEFSRNQAAQKAVLPAAMRSISLVHAPDFQN